MELKVNQNWTFEEVVNNIRALRKSYEDILCSFSYFQLRDKVKFKMQFRNEIYSLNLEEWQKNKIWDFLNHNEFYTSLLRSVNYLKSKGKGRKK